MSAPTTVTATGQDPIETPESTTPRPRHRSKWLSLDQSNPIVPYLLLAPHAVFFIWFTVYPIYVGASISVQQWSPLRDNPPFVGLLNYIRIFDGVSIEFQNFWSAFGNTVIFVVLTVPGLVLGALGLAVLVHRPIRGRSLFRTVFFLPTVLSVSVIAFVWRWIFGDQVGLISVLLRQWGVVAPQFLSTEGLAWVPVVLATLWWSVGLNFVIYLAGLSGIPESYTEAAQLDGANKRQIFRYVTLPLLGPTTLFVTVTTILGSFQVFGQTDLITNEGPNGTTRTILNYLTTEAFTNRQISSATAMSFVFGLLLLIITAVQFRIYARDAKAQR